MTYKDKVKEIKPDCVTNIVCGGVIGCPSTYFDMESICTLEFNQYWNKKDCNACWNNEYKGEPVL
ncbi:MAG: hypothetical protein E7577_03460 [Ruminococcaceae bacterium]|nr:hypothetical protein [Oscillospiraceae bacterium]